MSGQETIGQGMTGGGDLIAGLVAIAREAGDIALRFYDRGGETSADVRWKGDGSPVTEADMAVNEFLEGRLKALWPGAAWLSEESADDPSRIGAERVIIVDPIDGTRGFARGDEHWCVAIALCGQGRPVASVVHAPALGQTYTAVAGQGARLNGEPLHVDAAPAPHADMAVTCPGNLSRALRDVGVEFDYKPKIASLALRIVMVASGVYSAGFTARDCHDWDIAAADLVLQEAGGLLAGLDGRPLLYNQREPVHGVLTASPSAMQSQLRDALARTPFA